MATSRSYVIKGGPGDNQATLALGGVESRYWAPENGGYVRRVTDARPGTLGIQVCEGLAESGHCIEWNPQRGTLAELLRREARTSRGRAQIQWLREMAERGDLD